MSLALIIWAHLAGDFLLQTHTVSQNKPHSPTAMTIHIATYHLPMTAVALWLWGASPATAVFLTISAATHVLFDLRWPVVALMRLTGSEGFIDWPNGGRAGLLIFDQFCHYTALLIAYAIAHTLAGGEGL